MLPSNNNEQSGSQTNMPNAAPAVNTSTDSQVFDNSGQQQTQQQRQQVASSQVHQQNQTASRTNVTDNSSKSNNNNNNQCKKSLHHPTAPNAPVASAAPNFNTVDIDVTQLGLESPTSMNSSDLTNTSVETTPSQSYSDCAQVQNSACANSHKSSPGNYMETVSTYQMTSPVGAQMTSPSSSQGSFSLANQQPASNQSKL